MESLKKKKQRRIKDFIRTKNKIKKCSCHMCGNPRKYYGELSRKENQSLEDLNSLGQ